MPIKKNQSIRIKLIDRLRGHLLIAMILDHLGYVIGSTLFIIYNYNGNLWVSAAEGFVILSGLMVGKIYLNNNLTFKQLLPNILKRLLGIYLISVSFSIIYSLLFWNYPLPQSGIFKQEIRPDIFEIVLNSLIFKHHYGWSDILALYVYFLAITPILIYIFKRGSYLTIVILSITVWILDQIQILPTLSISHFNIYSWQLIFVLGTYLGVHLEKIAKTAKRYNRLKYTIPTLLLFTTAVILSINYPNIYIGNYSIFEKSTLGFGRLLLIPLWLISFSIILDIALNRLPKIFAHIYETLGRNSLFVYSLHSIVLAITTVWVTDKNVFINSSVTLILLLLIISITYIKQRYLNCILTYSNLLWFLRFQFRKS